MSETPRILTAEEVETYRDSDTLISAADIAQSHEALRTKLAAAEAERDEARAKLAEAERERDTLDAVNQGMARDLDYARERRTRIADRLNVPKPQAEGRVWEAITAALDGRDEARERAERDRLTAQRDELVEQLVDLFAWTDRSYTHASTHVQNAVRNLQADLAVVSRERDRLAAELGERRMCVNCGRTKPASEDRHEPLPECTGPDGHAACTFDMTPQEAWEHWRGEAHRHAALAAANTLEAQ